MYEKYRYGAIMDSGALLGAVIIAHTAFSRESTVHPGFIGALQKCSGEPVEAGGSPASTAACDGGLRHLRKAKSHPCW